MTDPQLEGVTLAKRLERGPFAPAEALEILEGLLQQVAEAHDAGLVHGGISPQKIIFSPDGKATLVGFPGRDPDAKPLARLGKVAQAPAFVSPEQITEDPIGRQSDLYSLAVVAYTMMVGKDPFGESEGVSADNVFYRILYKPYPRVPEATLAGLPTSVGPALDRAMSKEPRSRFVDARSFLLALGADEAKVPAPVPLSAKERKREEQKRKREAAEVVAASAATAAAADKLRQEQLEKDHQGQERTAREDKGAVLAAETERTVYRHSGSGRAWAPFLLAGAMIVILLAVGLGVAYAMGGIGGGGTVATVAGIDTTTTATAATTTTTTADDATTTSNATTTTSEITTTGTAELGTTTSEATTTTLAPVTTTTAKPTTTTAKPTTTTAKPTTTTTTLKTATIRVTDATTTYNGSPQHPSVTTSPAGLSVSYSITPTIASTYNVTITVTSPGYTGSTNTMFYINKANASISVPNRTVTWTGAAYGLTGGTATGVNGENLSSLLNVDSTTYVGDQAATNTYAIGWTFSGNTNYNSASGSAQLTIEAAPVETTTTTTTTGVPTP